MANTLMAPPRRRKLPLSDIARARRFIFTACACTPSPRGAVADCLVRGKAGCAKASALMCAARKNKRPHCPYDPAWRQGRARRRYRKALQPLCEPFGLLIGSIFNWFNDKTDLQNSGTVRSEDALMIHCFGKLIVAYLVLVFNPCCTLQRSSAIEQQARDVWNLLITIRSRPSRMWMLRGGNTSV